MSGVNNSTYRVWDVNQYWVELKSLYPGCQKAIKSLKIDDIQQLFQEVCNDRREWESTIEREMTYGQFTVRYCPREGHRPLTLLMLAHLNPTNPLQKVQLALKIPDFEKRQTTEKTMIHPKFLIVREKIVSGEPFSEMRWQRLIAIIEKLQENNLGTKTTFSAAKNVFFQSYVGADTRYYEVPWIESMQREPLQGFKMDSERQRLSAAFLYQVALQVRALHQHGLANCDIKTDNITWLWDDAAAATVKGAIIDEESTAPIHAPYDEQFPQGYKVMWPPEVLAAALDPALELDRSKWDVWSLGVTMLEFMLRKTICTSSFLPKYNHFKFFLHVLERVRLCEKVIPYGEARELYSTALLEDFYPMTLQKQEQWDGCLESCLSPLQDDFSDLIRKMLALDPQARPTMDIVCSVLQEIGCSV